MASTSSLSDSELNDWHSDEEVLLNFVKFHKTYAMPPEKLKTVKDFHEKVLKDLFDYLGVCADMRRIGGSYEGVKVVKSEDNDDFEFDVMFVLKLPEQCQLEIVEIPGRPGYAKLQFNNGHMNYLENNKEAHQQFFKKCVTFENDVGIIEAGKTTAAFFGKLQSWMNTKPVPGFKLLPKKHGTATQMDVIQEKIGENSETHNEVFYSVDIVPTIEILRGDEVQRYVAKPEKKRNPDSVTWRRLFDPDQSEADRDRHARQILGSALKELDRQRLLYELESFCILESVRTRMPLRQECILKLMDALVARKSSYRLTLIDLKDLNKGTNKRLVAVGDSFDEKLEVLPVPEKPGYAWLKLLEEVSALSRINNALKLCYLPGGKYLDTKAASDLLVAELRDIGTGLFGDQDVIVRRDGPIVRIEVYPEKENTMYYYSLEIVLAVYLDGNFYTGLPDGYDDVPDEVAWRRSYSYEETTKIQQAPEHLKMAFRVLKALRNREAGLASLTSYHFKTLLLNMLETVNWNRNIVQVFVSVLAYLKVRLSKKRLRTHFIREINLLENMINDCVVHLKNRIEQLLNNKRKMLKALENPRKETTDDVLRQHKNESASLEYLSVQGSSYSSFNTQLVAEIDEHLLGYDYKTITLKPVYEDIRAYRIFPGEVQYLPDYHVIMLIHNNRNNLRACRYNSEVIRLESCNSSVSYSQLRTVPHNSGLADTRKTAEYIKEQLERLLNQSALLSENVNIHLEGSHIVLKSSSNLRLHILPGYEVGEKIFIAMPGAVGSSAWLPIPFTPVRNKMWKAFKINGCGRKVLTELLRIQNRDRIWPRLSEDHFRMALFWEMEDQRDWSYDKVEERVNDVLDRLLNSVRQKSLPNYFDPTRNTL